MDSSVVERHLSGALCLDDAMRSMVPTDLHDSSPSTISSTTSSDRASTPVSSEDGSHIKSTEFEPIAIVGMGMRLPGGIRRDKDFWEFLIKKRDGVCKVPETRYNVDAFYDESKQHFVKTQYGYFLQEDPAQFDTGFFSINAYEAARLDPQQRLLMEVIWECMESAGQTQWKGDDIGCYVGVYGEDWLDLNSKDPHWIDRYHVLGTGNFALSNRISYEYDLKGPSMTFQTGCSSSLVGLHEACIALQAGDCSSAIVAGTNLIFTPTMTTTMSDNGVLAPDGICKTFDAAADGYGRGEAINALYIKPLKEALRAGDPVRAVIRSSSTNCDGKTPSITTPGSESQKRLIQKAYRRAGIDDITETAFFECHGTGTVIGDKNEVSVVADLFGSKGVYIGAVKPNVGHSEGASGLTSVIKAVLALENNTIPPNVHFREPSPEIPFKSARLQVPTEATSWPKDRKPRVSVNCFGIGGANAHVILDSALSFMPSSNITADQPQESQDKPQHLLVLSASSAASLQKKVKELKLYTEQNSPKLEDLAYTLALRREHLLHRSFVIGDETGINVPDQLTVNKSNFAPLITYVFTGQGAQWAGMGRDLLKTYDNFARDIQAMDYILQSLQSPPQWTIEQELSLVGDASRINDAELSQTLCTAVQIAIVNLLSSWGVQAGSVVGHSSGEIAAAYSANALTLQSAIIVAYYRGQAAKNCQVGSMAAVGMSPVELRPFLLDGVVVACENSPQSTTISGDFEQVEKVLNDISQKQPDVFQRKLHVKVAYHSHHMRTLGSKYEELIKAHITLTERKLPFFSTVTGSLLSNEQNLDSAYWRRNLESPVLFSSAISDIMKNTQKNQLFLEIGPHSALGGPIRQIVKGTKASKECVYASTLTRGTNQVRSMLEAAGQLYSLGVPVELEHIIATDRKKSLVDLPLYPWDHDERYWHETRATQSWRLREFPHHELLGSKLFGSSSVEPIWKNLLRLEDVPWLSDHVLCNDIVFPGAGYIAMVGEAIRQMTGSETYMVKNLFLKAPLFLHEMQATEILTSMKPGRLTDYSDAEYYDFTITAYDGKGWVKHCQGQAWSSNKSPEPKTIEPFIRKVSEKFWYKFMANLGLSYGPRFQGLENITANPADEVAYATSCDGGELHESHYSIHPTIIDQNLQLMGVAASRGRARIVDKLCVPVFMEIVHICKAVGTFKIQAAADRMSGTTISGNVVAAVDDQTVLSINGGSFFSIDDHQGSASSNIPLTTTATWKPDIDLLSQKSLLPYTPIKRSTEVYPAIISLCIIETALEVRGLQPVTDHLAKYQSWVCNMLSQVGGDALWLAPEAAEWVMLSSPDRRSLFDQNVLKIPSDDHELLNLAGLMRHVMESASDVIQGKKQPLEVLFQDDKMKTLYNSSRASDQWKHFFSALVHSNPRLRILEIGAGTGGTTAVALELLRSSTGVPMFQSYTFTDISVGFLKSAEERFQDQRGISYKVLDITQNPLQQGFESSSYDLIIASNVMHATPTLQSGLVNVRKLLAPGGRFLLQELSPTLPFADYIMGLLPGWWLGGDDGRPDRPYVEAERWHNELQMAGLTGIEAQSYDDEKPYQTNINILARKPSEIVTDTRVTLVSQAEPTQWEKEFAKQLHQKGFSVIWGSLQDRQPTTRGIIFLLDLRAPFFDNISESDYESFKKYISACPNAHIMWIMPATQSSCENPRYGLVSGLARSLRKEMMLDFSTVEVDNFNMISADAIIRTYEKFRKQAATSMPLEYEYMISDGIVNICRYEWNELEEHVSYNSALTETKKISMKQLGLIDTLEWTLSDEESLGPEEISVDMAYCGLNFKDIMISMGVIGSVENIGIEGSGVVRSTGAKVKELKEGDQVILFGSGMMRTRVKVKEDRCIKMPSDLSLEDAATMPAVFATAIYSLLHIGLLKKDQSVLVHSACGGVGLAAIQICQVVGAKVYATVGNEEKISYLQETCGIPRDRIFNSRDDSFLEGIMKATNGKGVKLVLNSLSGKLLHASWRCVAKFGKMIELGKRDLIGHGMLSMDPFLENRSFFGVDLSTITEEDPSAFKELLVLFMDWFKEGKIKPIRPVTVFESSQIVEAFRYMQKGVHMGKIVIKMPEKTSTMVVSPPKPKFSLSSEASYLLVGGLGGIGQAISNFLVEKGARHLTFLSRSAGQSEEHASFGRELQAQGCEFTFVQGSVTNMNDVERAVQSSGKCIAGVIQLSMVLKDQSFSKMTLGDWNAAVSPKVAGTWNLHTALEHSSLDFFVAFGSVSGTCGNTGQANYAAANSFLDAFVQYRRNQGLPGSVLDLGFVGDVGVVSQDQKLLNRADIMGTRLVLEKDIMDALELVISNASASAIKRTESDERCLFKSSPLVIGLSYTKLLNDCKTVPFWGNDRRFLSYENYELPSSETKIGSDEADLREFMGQISKDPVLLEQDATETKILQELGKVIVPHTACGQQEHMTDEEISGVAIDSLISIEIKNWARRKLAIDIALTEISKAATIGGLAKLTVAKLKLKYAPQQEGEAKAL